MKNVKKYIMGVLAIMLLMHGVQTALGATVDELQEQISALLKQVQALQGQSGASITNPAVGYRFTRNLKAGSKGADVKKLQDFLKAEGYLTIANTTTTFGPATKAALIRWQKAEKIAPASGFFGVLTRARVNASLASATPTMPVTPSASYISRPVAAAVGSSVAIKFTSTGERKVNIYLCRTKDDCNTVIAANVPASVGENAFNWNVPADVASGAYTIKIEDVANSAWAVYTDVPLTQPVATATSTPPATQPVIAALSLQLPNSTKIGDLLVIKFTSKNAKNVSIVLCSDSEHCDVAVTSKFAVTDGLNNYIWTVPTSTPATKQYFVKMKDADNANSLEFTSDLFTIAALPVVVVAPTVSPIDIAVPNATRAGSAVGISYTTKGLSNIDIYLCASTTKCEVTIKKGLAVTDGVSTYAWTIPTSVTAGEYYIKITAANSTSPSAMTKTSFKITTAPQTICRTIQGPVDLTTTCDVSEEAISGRCYTSLLPDISVPAPKVTLYPTGMGAVCSPVGGTLKVSVYCCKTQ